MTAPTTISAVTATGRYMPMPTPSAGKERPLPPRRSTSSASTAAAPIRAPRPIRFQSRVPPSTPWAMAEMSAACGEAKAAIQQIENRGDDHGAENDAEHERKLLPPWRRGDQLARLQVLQIVVGNRRNAEDDRRHEQGKSDQALGRVGVGSREDQRQ